MNTATMAAAARARGLDVHEFPDIHGDEIVLDLSLSAEVALIAYPEDTRPGDVQVVLVHPTWSYQEGPGSDEHDYGILPLSEALSYAAWFGKAEALAYDRAEAEIDAYVEAAAPEPQES